MRNGVYWCYRGKAGQAKLPDESIQQFLREKHGYFVAIDGFDALMVEIGKTLYGDDIRPGRTAEQLKEKHDRRVQQYNQQWDNLNERPEIQEVLQEMNVAEQREEEQREKKQALTAWDYIRRGLRASSEGRKEDAIKEYSKAIEMDPRSAAAYNNRGIVYDDLEQYEKAIEDYNKAIELNLHYAAAYNNRGVAYDNLKQYERAIEDYNKAIELDSNYASAYNNRGIVYADLKRYKEAIEDYTQAIKLNPKYKKAYQNRAKAYLAIGEKELAKADEKTAEEL